jgi:hypothetical protein
MISIDALPRLAVVVLASAVIAYGQSPSALPTDLVSPQPAAPSLDLTAPAIPVPVTTPAVQMIQSFNPDSVKFDLDLLIRTLRDRNHEGWVLAAYPDPKTGQPLIGAGVSIDLPAREHPQRDPLNPNPFVEPASAELWQAAGLEPDRLNRILDQFHHNLDAWGKQDYRSRIGELPAQITEQEATGLLRAAIVQSILNARAYCRNFDQLTDWQQMALSQLVFQMGINLEEFSQFLDMINRPGVSTGRAPSVGRRDGIAAPTGSKAAAAHDIAFWRGVQKSLIQSQWARLYRPRAISVIAMLDPRYDQNPRMAERRVGAVLRPAVIHRHRGRRHAASELASTGRRSHGVRRRHSRRKA